MLTNERKNVSAGLAEDHKGVLDRGMRQRAGTYPVAAKCAFNEKDARIQQRVDAS